MRILLADFKNNNSATLTKKYEHPQDDLRGLERIVYDYTDLHRPQGYELTALAEIETDESGHEIFRVLNRVYYTKA